MTSFTRFSIFIAPVLILAFAVCAPAFAADYYVDGSNGDDSNSGMSAEDAWKTITHALSAVEASQESPATIHVAEGIYSASANGETFPLVLTSHVRLTGEGQERSILDGESVAAHLIEYESASDTHLSSLGLQRSLWGAIDCKHVSLSIHDCAISENGHSNGGTTGVTCFGSDLRISRCRIHNNEGTEAIDALSSKTQVSGCEISRNAGAAVRCVCGTLEMRECLVEDNLGLVNELCSSGAFLECQEMDALVDNCVIIGNTQGPACTQTISCYLSTMLIRQCLIKDNHSYNGVITCNMYGEWTRRTGRLYLQDTILSNNTSHMHTVIGAYSGYSRGLLSVERCVIGGNQPEPSWSHEFYVMVNACETMVNDSIIWDNEGGILKHTSEDMSCDVTVDHCCLQEEFEGEGNFVADPEFASGPLGDYYLSCFAAGQDSDSPCIDAGSTSASIVGMDHLTTRTDNVFDSGILDIGYHYSAAPPTIECEVGDGSDALGALPLEPGQRLVASVTLDNGGSAIWVDLYAGFILPNGSILCMMDGGFSPDLGPFMSPMLLPEGLPATAIDLFETLIPYGLPTGTYYFAAALSLTGEFRPIGDIAFASFAIGD